MVQIYHHATIPVSREMENVRGWESIAGRWGSVGWPRRPRWSGEFSKALPMLASAHDREALVLGATPEFRSWLSLMGARVSLLEKSEASHRAMSSIMREQSRLMCAGVPLIGPMRHKHDRIIESRIPETLIRDDWEGRSYERGRFSLIMGDIVTGYMETRERLSGFFHKIHGMLAPGGVFLLRDFVKSPFPEQKEAYLGLKPDARRWAYILTDGFAVEGDTFYEEKLARNSAKAGDLEVLSTCADPPRTRLMLDLESMLAIAAKYPLEMEVLIPPAAGRTQPALMAFHKRV